MERRDEEHPFYMYAAGCWPIFARNDEWTDQSLIDSAISLFNPMKTGNLVSWAHQLLHSLACDNHKLEDDEITRLASQLAHRTFTPLHMAATMSLPVICSALLEDDSGINQKSGFGTPLQCAVQGLLLVDRKGDGARQLRRAFRSYHVSTGIPSQKSPKNYMTDTINILLNAGADHNVSCSSPFLGWSLIAIALEATVKLTDNLTAISALLEFGVEPNEEDINKFDFLSRTTLCCVSSLELEFFIRSLSPMTEKSTAHFKLCQMAWSLAINLGCGFSSDTSIVDTRISLADDALMEALFASIRNEDFQRLASVVEDPRIRSIDAIEPASGCSAFEVAAGRLGDNDCLNVFRTLLDAGCHISKPDSQGLWPVHTLTKLIHNENYDGICEIYGKFVHKGTGCTLLTRQGQNVLHLGCSSPVFIEAVFTFETQEDVAAALETQDEQGYTPISLAISKGKDEGALLLLQRAGCRRDTLRSPISILPLCVKTNCPRTFDYLVGAGIDSLVVGTNGPTLLHYINCETSTDFLDRLMSLQLEACTLRTDGKFPIDVYLNM